MNTLTVRPVRFSSNPAGWQQLIGALGGSQLPSDPSWNLFALSSGRLAVHEVAADDPRHGLSRLVFETLSPAEFLEDLGALLPARLVDYTHGRQLEITGPDGAVLLVDEPATAGDATGGGPRVMPLWMTPDVDGAIAVLLTLGLQGRIKSDSGQWGDFTSDGGGMVAVHHGAVEFVLSFEDDDVTDLAGRLQAAGIQCRLIDESFGLTLRVPDPDGGDEIWINETQRDLYGYHAL